MNSSELGKSVTGIKSVTGAPLPAKPKKTNSSALGKSVTGIKSVTGAPLPAETISAKIINSPVVENSHSGLQSVAVMSLLPEVNSVTDINPPEEENSFGFGSPKGDALGPPGEGAFGSQSDNSLQPSDDGFDDSEGGSHQDGDDQSVEGDLDSSGPDDASSISDEALKVRKSSKRDKKEEDKLVSIVLMKLTQKLDAVLLNQAVIIRAVDPDMAKVIRPEEFPHTPLAKVKHFAKLEKFLKNATNFAAMRDKMLMSIGGCGDERKATGRILTDLFQYSCAKDVSWGGSKGMTCAFGQSETCKALFGAIGMAYKGTDLTQCELKIKDWLRTAPSVYERLMKRKMSKQ